MKKNQTLILVILFSFFSSYAIEWAPIGTTWYYHYSAEEAYGYILMESVKDTTLEDKICKMLSLTENSYAFPGEYIERPFGTIYTYQEGSKVYILQRDTISLLYDFDPQPGDIWDLFYSAQFTTDTLTCNGGKVIVDSVKQVQIDHQILNEIYTSNYDGSGVGFRGTIIEGIGSLFGIYPYSSSPCSGIVDYTSASQLRCFYSSDMDTSFTDVACDYITQTKIPNEIDDVRIFPNPAQNSITVVADANTFSYPVDITIFSLTGETVLSTLITNKQEIDISALSSGSYIVQLTDSNIKNAQYKFIKQ